MLTNVEGPDWMSDAQARPVAYDYLVRRGLVGVRLGPWTILSLEDVVCESVQLERVFPGRGLVVFARCSDSGRLACWSGEFPGQVVAVGGLAGVSSSGGVGPFLEVAAWGDGVWGWLRCVAQDVTEWLAANRADEPGEVYGAGQMHDPGEGQSGLSSGVGRFVYGLCYGRSVPEWVKGTFGELHLQGFRSSCVTEADWIPWRFLPDDEVTVRTVTLHGLYPDRRFVVFAHRVGGDVLACWDAARGDGVVYVVGDCYASGAERSVVPYPDMLQWFRSVVVEDYIAEGKKWVQGQVCGE